MDAETLRVIRACTEGSDRGTTRFPEVIAALAGAGVERYHADLLRAEKVYYLPDGESAPVACARVAAVPAAAFDPAGVEAAVSAAQAGAVDYGEFCRRIAQAGCVGYHVSLPGRRAVYYGRTAEVHVEHFPS